jgi:NADH-quinone oxidoreductase subunit L
VTNLVDYPLLIPIVPLAAGLIIGLFGRALGPKSCRIGVAAEAIAFALAVLVLYEVTTYGSRTIQLSGRDGELFQFAFRLDRLSAVLLVHIAAISILIHLFSIRYMQQERGYARFHSLLAFTTFVLFGMVSSANLLMLFMFWQLLSWLLPLLSYNYPHPPTVRGAFRTFIMQRAGDIAFLSAVVLAFNFYGTLDTRQLALRAGSSHLAFSWWPGGLEINAATVVTLLLFVAAMSKSAQIPLHMWLPDSLYAPTPVHALLHAGIINAGGFLLARMAGLYALSPATLHLVFAIGMLTALLGSSMMLVQNDIKKTLGYSTIGQMGFMIMECGLGGFGLAIFHLIAHGLFKGTIFLNCGYVIHSARQEPRQPFGHRAATSAPFSALTWITGFIATLILPLVIVLAAHGILNIPLSESQGAVIFLFFGWATSSQAILTLYRLRAAATWKVAASMLAALFLVALTYLMAAERFSYFLFAAPGEVDYYFKAAALPGWLFDFIVAGFALLIIFGWYLIYARSHGKTIRVPDWVRNLQVALYLFLINRLYLDAVSMRLGRRVGGGLQRFDRSQLFSYGAALFAAATALPAARSLFELGAAQAATLLAALVLLPLFPFQRPYVAAVARLPAYSAIAAAILFPAAGLSLLINVADAISVEILNAIGWLALFGALYASLKALAQPKITDVAGYGSAAWFAPFWWHFALTKNSDGAATVYVIGIALLTVGLLLAAERLRRRYGNLSLDRMHGLARSMPCFATLFALLIMAAVGLPPFGFFSSHLEILVQSANVPSLGMLIVLVTWLMSSWCWFRMMHRLLFGPRRNDLFYEDLRTGEAMSFVVVLLAMGLLAIAPRSTASSERLNHAQRSLMETSAWRK